MEGDAEGRYAVVATTRPETIMGDTAMCINPNDPKNAWLKGKKVIVPLVNRVIPVIEDDYVDIEFGTGCLKVTPAHDVNDYILGEKYNLLTNIETVHTDIHTGSFTQCTVVVENVNAGQIVLFTQHIVIHVMSRSHFLTKKLSTRKNMANCITFVTKWRVMRKVVMQ